MAGKGKVPRSVERMRLAGERPGRAKPPPGIAPGAPKCPSWLPAEAKSKWKEVVPVLQRAGVLSVLDRSVLSAFCVAWAEFVEATRLLEKEGRTAATGEGGLKPHPAAGMQRTAMNALRLLGGALGLSPEGRLRLHLPNDRVRAGADDPDDFDRFFFEIHGRYPGDKARFFEPGRRVDSRDRARAARPPDDDEGDDDADRVAEETA